MQSYGIEIDLAILKALGKDFDARFCELITEFIEEPYELASKPYAKAKRVMVRIPFIELKTALGSVGITRLDEGIRAILSASLTAETSEKSYQLKLASDLKKLGQKVRLEVCCPIGRIDILTETEVIEVKHYHSSNGLKHALGQVLAYSYYYPKHKKRLALIGKPIKQMELKEVEQICQHYEVTLQWL